MSEWKPNLRDLAVELKNLLDKAADGELDTALELAINNIEGAFDKKHDAIRKVMAELQARGTTRAVEHKRLEDLANADQRSHDRLKLWLKTNMELAGLKVVETDLFRTSVANNGGSPSIEFLGDVRQLPESLRKTIETVSLDREAILQKHKAGETLPDGITIKRGTHLRMT